jgi:uncharacterized protein YbjT (DUF2867 family)
MRGKLITVFGGSGFLGSYLIPKLTEQGALVRVAVRNVDQALNLKVSGYVGQVEIVSVNPSDATSVAKAIGDSDYVVNLIGILFESGKNTFERVHVNIPKTIAIVAKKNAVQKLVHVSAIGANPHAESRYATSKGRGEAEVLKAFPDATILRPSVIFGAEDNFLNKFAAMACVSPFLPLIAGGKMKLQPVYVGDVAEAILRSFNTDASGKIYELGGPSIYTFKELMNFILQETRREAVLLRIPYSVASLMGSIMQILPSPALTRDQVRLIKTNNIVALEALTLKDLGIEATALETIAPFYLERYRRKA